MAPEIDVWPVQLPGRETRINEKPFTDVTSLVQAIGEVIDPCLNVPFGFFGHSYGGLIGFELARHLRRYGGPDPTCLFVSGCGAPDMPKTESPIHNLPENEFLEEIRQLNSTPQEVLENKELRNFILPSLRADFKAVETYRFYDEIALSYPLFVLGGLQDGIVERSRLEGWKAHTSSIATLKMFPGDHFFLKPMQSCLLRLVSSKVKSIIEFSA